MMSAYTWGVVTGSCPDALDWRQSLGPDATQADAYAVCAIGHWLLWQLNHLFRKEARDRATALLTPIVEDVVVRAICREVPTLRGIRSPGATRARKWAQDWLSGLDRSGGSAWSVWEQMDVGPNPFGVAAAASYLDTGPIWLAAWNAECYSTATKEEIRIERLRQANAIRRIIPKWPGRI